MRRPAKKIDILKVIDVAVCKGLIHYSSHANHRMGERRVVKPEVEFVLVNGSHEPAKDQFNVFFGSWDYAIKGKTVDGRRLRIVVAVESTNILVVTVIDLERED